MIAPVSGEGAQQPDVVYGPQDWRPLNEAPMPDVPTRSIRCAGVKEMGEPCNALAVGGTIFCRVHGGTTVSVQAQARARLDQVRSVLFDTLVDAAKDAVEVYTEVMRHGKRDADRLRAADSVLKLLGFDESVSQVPGGDAPVITSLDQELTDLFRRAAVDRLSRVIDVASAEHEEVSEPEPSTDRESASPPLIG